MENFFKLSKKELKILELFTLGFDKNEIKEMLNIQNCTLQTHLQNIYNKLELEGGNKLVQAVAWYLSKKLYKYEQTLKETKTLLLQIDENNWLHTGKHIYMDEKCISELKLRITTKIDEVLKAPLHAMKKRYPKYLKREVWI